MNCTSLFSIKIPLNVTSIHQYTFVNARHFLQSKFQTYVTSKNDYAFCGCRSLTEIGLNDGLETIGTGAFMCCTSLFRIMIPPRLQLYVTTHCTVARHWRRLFSRRHPMSHSEAFSKCSMLTAYQFHQLQPPSLWMHSRVPLYWGMSQSRQNLSWSKKHHLTRLSLPFQIWELLLIWWCKDLMSCLYTDFVLSITHPMTFNQWTTLHLKGLIKPSTSFQHMDFNKLPRNDA